MSQTYGTEIEDPDRDNKAIYKKYDDFFCLYIIYL